MEGSTFPDPTFSLVYHLSTIGALRPGLGCGLGVSHRCCSLVYATILLQRHAQSGLNPALIMKSDLTKLSPISRLLLISMLMKSIFLLHSIVMLI